MPDGIEKKPHDEIMRDEEIILVVQESVKIGITKVRITGGEPMLRKGIYELLRKINNVEGIKELTITTNATLIKGNIHRLKEAGVTRVNFSLDTLDSEKYRYITKSDITLDYEEIIQELIAHNLQPIKINAVLLRGFNDYEIPDFIALADKYNLYFRLIELMPIGHLNFDYEKYFISKDEILVQYPQLVFHSKSGVSEYYQVEGKKGYIGFINPISHKFCSECNRIRLTADGHLKPCLLSNDEIMIKNIQPKELLSKLKEAIRSKPISHDLDKNTLKNQHRSMNKIGG
jgi:cyclic pyranopterin phosphate synthase